MTAARAPKLGLYRDQWHRYTYCDGTRTEGPLVGVTSVLKLQDVMIGGDLAAWGGRIAAGHLLRYDREVLAMIDDTKALDAALSAVSAARDIGTAVHGQIEAILRQQPVTPTPETAPFVYAFTSFLATERPEFLGVEQMVANLTYRYAGTYDFGAKLRGRTALVDVKTGKLKRSHRLQLAAYAAAEFAGFEGDPERHPVPRFRDHYVLLLKPDGSYDLVDMQVTAADRRHFLSLTRTYHRIREWEERVA